MLPLPQALVLPLAGGFRTKQALVHQTLRSAIVDGRLDPGRRLVIDEIATAMGVSPIPVREALSLLQSEGLVVVRPHQGAVVAEVPRESLGELFDLIEGLELVAVRRAAGRADAAAVALLRDLLGEMRRAAGAGDQRCWSGLNVRFHLAIIDVAALPLTRELTERVLGEWERLRRHAFPDAPPPEYDEADREHADLIEAIVRGDAAGAEAIVRAHNRGARRHYESGASP